MERNNCEGKKLKKKKKIAKEKKNRNERETIVRGKNIKLRNICKTRSLRALRAPTSSQWPFGPA